MIKPLLKTLYKWARQNKAAVAVEFALLSLPYFMLTFGVIEISVAYATATMLESATFSASRIITTGQLVGDTPTTAAGKFKTAICDNMPVFVPSCASNADLVISSEITNNFADSFSNISGNPSGNLVTNSFSYGSADSNMLIRVQYTYTFMTPFIGQLISPPDGQINFISTVATQNEPY